MSAPDDPQAVLRQRPAVAVLEAVPRTLGYALLAALFLGPFVGSVASVVLASGAVAPGRAVVGAFVGFGGLILAWAALTAGVATYGTEYHIYDDHVEVRKGLLEEERQTIPRSKIRHVRLSQGLLEQRFGVGDLNLRTRQGSVDVTLQNVDDAGTWYERLRPVNGGEPLETVQTHVGAMLIRGFPFAVMIVGTVAMFAFIGAWSLGGLLGPGGLLAATGLVAAGAVLALVALTAGAWIRARNTEYRFHDDHIERHVDALGTERSFVETRYIRSVEYNHGLVERLWSVGTISIEAKWYSEPFRLETVHDAERMYEKLRQVT